MRVCQTRSTSAQGCIALRGVVGALSRGRQPIQSAGRQQPPPCSVADPMAAANYLAEWRKMTKRELGRKERSQAERESIQAMLNELAQDESRRLKTGLTAEQNLEMLEEHRETFAKFMTDKFAKKGMKFCKRELNFVSTRCTQRKKVREKQKDEVSDLTDDEHDNDHDLVKNAIDRRKLERKIKKDYQDQYEEIQGQKRQPKKKRKKKHQ